MREFSAFYRYFIFVNRSDYNTNVYNTSAECVADLRKNKGHSSVSLRQTILISQNQNNIMIMYYLRAFNGASHSIYKENKKALSLVKNNKKVDRRSFVELQDEKMDIYPIIDEESFENTLSYLYRVIGEGIFVKIKNNILVSFLPFIKSNKNLEFFQTENNNRELLEKINDQTTHISIKFNCCNIETDTVDNYILKKKYSIIKMYLLETIRYQTENSPTKSISDAEFFINTSNCSVLQEELKIVQGLKNYEDFIEKLRIKINKSNDEIGDRVGDDGDRDKSIKELKMMPILSISTNYRYADILMPSVQDWITSLSLNDSIIYSMNCTVKEKPVNSKWEEKKDMFLFRGYIDDCGMNVITNRKLNIVYKGMDNDMLDAKLIRSSSSGETFNIDDSGGINIESIPDFIQLEDGENYLPMDQFYCNHSENIPFTQYII